MSWEIERRYLVSVEEGAWKRFGGGLPYRQGYVRNGKASVRIRTGEPRGPVLTCKTGTGVKRREVEAVVSPEMAEALFIAAGKRIIEKVRYPVGRWELDRFTGPLEGLTLLEIELDDPDDPIPGPPNGIEILREVTDDKRLTSGALSRLSKKEKATLVRKVYQEVRR